MGKRPRLDQPFTTCTRDEPHLETDIHRFKTEHKVPEGLGCHVYSSEEHQASWYEELSNIWPEEQPSSEEAAKLVLATLAKLHHDCVSVLDLEGFLLYYGLSDYAPPSMPPSLGEGEDAMDPLFNTLEDSKSCVDIPKDEELFRLNTLPVSKNVVKDGRCFTVHVEVNGTYLLPTEIFLAKNRLLSARVNGNQDEANELLQTIARQDYELKEVNNHEVLTKKYEIQLLRDLAGTDDVAKARKFLARRVGGKCLMIKVFQVDEQLRCV